jgi:hypothetical protein
VLSAVPLGAATSIHLASAPDLEQVTGRYFANSKPKRSSERSYNEAAANRALAGQRRSGRPDRGCVNHVWDTTKRPTAEPALMGNGIW